MENLILSFKPEEAAGTVLERFVNEGGCDGVGAGEIGDGTRHPHGAMEAPRGEIEARGGAHQRLLRRRAETAFLIQLPARERGVRRTLLAGTLFNARARLDDALADSRAGFAG